MHVKTCPEPVDGDARLRELEGRIAELAAQLADACRYLGVTGAIQQLLCLRSAGALGLLLALAEGEPPAAETQLARAALRRLEETGWGGPRACPRRRETNQVGGVSAGARQRAGAASG